jgi:hypothetical protein
MRNIPTTALILALLMGLVGVGHAAEGDAQSVIEQAIQAQGGDRLTRLQIVRRDLEGIMLAGAQELRFTAELAAQPPDKSRGTFHLDPGGRKLLLIVVVNGKRGWQSAGGAVSDLPATQLDELREDGYVTWVQSLLPLKEKAFSLAPLPEAQVNGKATVGVRVSQPGRPDVELYFDKVSHLLVKTSRKTKEAGQPITKETVFTDHKDFDGLWLPTHVTDFKNGKKVAELRITGYRFPSTPDESLFARP